jgi:predicted Zn-dependent peptidase
LIAQRKANLAQNCAVRGTLSRRVWPGLVFGTEHPYGRCTSQAQYDALGVSECAETFSGLSCRGARLYVAGSTTEPELRALFGDRVAAWAARVDVPTTNPTIEAIAATPSVLAFAEIPGAAQSQVLLGHPGPSRDVPDYEALELMAQILGGGFSSRINMKIREEKGQSYSARAGFSFHRQGSSFSAGAAVHREATAETLRDLAQEIARMRDELVTADELEREREGTLLGLPARFATAERVRDTIAGLVFHDLPLDYHAGYAQRLAQVQAPAVREAARAHLRAAEGGRCALVVGDGAVREAVQSAAEDLGFDAWHDIDAADAAGAMPGT